MNVKREDQFPWPLTIEFFESAYEPLDWKYQVYVKSRKEFKHFKRYALIYGLEFNRCKFKLSFIKNDDDKENELYYILKLLGVKTEKIFMIRKRFMRNKISHLIWVKIQIILWI